MQDRRNFCAEVSKGGERLITSGGRLGDEMKGVLRGGEGGGEIGSGNLWTTGTTGRRRGGGHHGTVGMADEGRA